MRPTASYNSSQQGITIDGRADKKTCFPFVEYKKKEPDIQKVLPRSIIVASSTRTRIEKKDFFFQVLNRYYFILSIKNWSICSKTERSSNLQHGSKCGERCCKYPFVCASTLSSRQRHLFGSNLFVA